MAGELKKANANSPQKAPFGERLKAQLKEYDFKLLVGGVIVFLLLSIWVVCAFLKGQPYGLSMQANAEQWGQYGYMNRMKHVNVLIARVK